MRKRHRRKRDVTCHKVEGQLVAYIKGGLPAARWQAIHDHLALCAACAESKREAEALEAALQAEAARHRPILPPQASARIQAQIYRRLRWGLIVRRTVQATGRAVGQALILALIIAVVAIWRGVPQESGPAAGPEEVTIVFASTAFGGIQPNALQPLRDLARDFHATHPNIIVQVKQPSLRGGAEMDDVAQEADCFSWSPPVHGPDGRGAILSLDPFLDADPSFSIDDFYPLLLTPFIRGGQLWGLPSQARPEVILYNKDLFDAAGVDYPAPDWTSDDFLEVAIALTQGEGEGKQYGFVGGVFDFYELVWALERRGARLIDASLDPPAVAFNDPSTARALRWYADLSTLYGVKPTFGADIAALIESLPTAFEERETLIKDGRAAMWTILESWELTSDRGGMNLGVASIPAGPGVAAGAYKSVFGYFISAHTEAGQACWEWITYLTEQPEAFWGVPVRRSILQSEAYRQRVGTERAAVYETSVTGTDQSLFYQPLQDQQWLVVALLWLGQAHGEVIEGRASVEDALDAAQQAFDDFRACLIARDAFSDAKEMQACALEVDPAFPVALFPSDTEE
jgi:ABC-type glycerol-3-phosphate transport system substrate-binding protein